jgi:cytochrome c
MLGLDGFELNKIIGAVLGTLLAAMGLGLVAEAIYHTEPPERPGFAIEVAEAPTAPDEAGPASAPIASLLAHADAEKGVTAGRPCLACHSFEKGGAQKTGPNLWDIVGRAPGAVAGFAYSDAMKAKAGEPWTYETLDKFIADPKSYLPGTKMSYSGLKRDDARADLIAYLRTLSDNPKPLPEAAAQSGTTAPAAAPDAAGAAPDAPPSAVEGEPAVTPEGQTQAQ